MMTKERNVVLSVRCNLCNKVYAVYVTEESYKEFNSPNRRHIQDIFPYLDAGDRELLISQTCNACWDKMFPPEEEEEYYDIDQVIEVIKDLAKSQGKYKRLLDNITHCKENEPKVFESFKTVMESKKFKDPVDIVMYFES